MRHLLPVLLSLVLGLSLAGQGAVRLSVATGTTVILCTGDGAVAVTVGPDGTPVPATGHHHCPDCLPLAAMAAPAMASPAFAPRGATRLAAPPGCAASPTPIPRHPPARGPPQTPVA